MFVRQVDIVLSLIMYHNQYELKQKPIQTFASKRYSKFRTGYVSVVRETVEL